ncbi:MAG TPA: hypothetical protein VLY03_08430 [Bacteroidota bacterium]|nr:hypothetical protein [Bacteroidota bacterium]
MQTGRNDEQETRGVGAADEEEVIAEAIRRETFMSDFYRYILDKIGYDVQPIIAQMIDEQQKRIQLLERVQFDIHERRELTGSIAD